MHLILTAMVAIAIGYVGSLMIPPQIKDGVALVLGAALLARILPVKR